jgi:hypothetical protein
MNYEWKEPENNYELLIMTGSNLKIIMSYEWGEPEDNYELWIGVTWK